MKALVIGKIWPEPTSSAAGTRTLDILRALEGYELHFACAAQKSEYSSDLLGHFQIRLHQIELNNSQFNDWVAALNPEIVIFDRFMIEEQFGWRVAKSCPDALRVIDTSDLHFLREARRQAVTKKEEPKFFNDTAVREVAAMLRSDLSIVISEFEYTLLVSKFQFPVANLAYWPFLLPAPSIDVPRFEDRSDYVMIGSYLHEPNWDAVRWCSESIWPLIRQKLPDAQLHAYGSYTPQKAYDLHKPENGFHIKGRAEEAVSTLAKHRINLAPLRFGAGLKGKLADAFIAGTPSITTPVGVEGMKGDLDWGSVVSDQPEIFADTACKLYTDKKKWIHAQRRGSEIATQRFAESKWIPELGRMLENSLNNLAHRRESNFLGRMLNYHHHRSTEFMSRWIEEKNKRLPSDPS